MNDDNIIIPSLHISSISYHPAKTVTAGYAAENDGEWKNLYIICAGNAETPGKIIRKKSRKVLALNRAMLYNTDVSRERTPNPGHRERNPGIGAEKVTSTRNQDF